MKNNEKKVISYSFGNSKVNGKLPIKFNMSDGTFEIRYLDKKTEDVLRKLLTIIYIKNKK